MKKLIAVMLAVCTLFSFFLLPAAAQNEENAISLRLNSNIAGCTRADADKLIEILSGPVKYCYDEKGYSIFIANCVGGMEGAHMDAGRTYVITYTLEASDGYVLPETLSDGDVSLDCAKGVSVISCGVVEQKNTDPAKHQEKIREVQAAAVQRTVRENPRIVRVENGSDDVKGLMDVPAPEEDP